MKTKNFIDCEMRELTPDELKFIDGGAPSKSTSFWYDAFYYTFRGIGEVSKEIFTSQFWKDWELSIL